ncbi:hypothetical protein H5410_051069 [Solanum commersonii]|uniref:Uncharacterized protein n=1 Tax=Solanum commersonii TaxID=4109 RepID=A0A9J5WXD6_SOLCO|nr:hypothetical protein H5410_051069 [Solanum commersonii]
MTTLNVEEGNVPCEKQLQMGKGSRPNGFVTSRKGLALRVGHGVLVWNLPSFSRFNLACRPGTYLEWLYQGTSLGVKRPTQNWYKQGEYDYLIKTKHCDAPNGCLCNAIYAQ